MVIRPWHENAAQMVHAGLSPEERFGAPGGSPIHSYVSVILPPSKVGAHGTPHPSSELLTVSFYGGNELHPEKAAIIRWDYRETPHRYNCAVIAKVDAEGKIKTPEGLNPTLLKLLKLLQKEYPEHHTVYSRVVKLVQAAMKKHANVKA